MGWAVIQRQSTYFTEGLSSSMLPNLSKFVLPKRLAEITFIEAVWRMPSLTYYGRPGLLNRNYTYSGLKRFWTELCTILANMESLSHLKIVLPDYHGQDMPLENRREMWLVPLDKLKGKSIKMFEIWVPESYAVHFTVDEPPQFKLYAMISTLM
ncbi:uncharacterized protein K444DRAFT_631395 [Hyaloscypha bicolor E]|jgi:hypothetical protein|uniref:DUF7730 domain-containing protein n=1 Tax=Hyaloscypha bicolor E TaxID=1095630 RepID=A0A2J6T4U2_9HELO|nr:uncharacterized protein K444DRAFT_631395 [Hyaloscypha bicolor E]PMD58035.1 hypothetical protein K444DRAFT_631395 [Hyaloscypha bicolor E]